MSVPISTKLLIGEPSKKQEKKAVPQLTTNLHIWDC